MQCVVKIRVSNFDDVVEFANIISSKSVFRKLSEDEKLKILYSYPMRFEIC